MNTTISNAATERSDLTYHDWLDNVAESFNDILKNSPGDPLFLADVPGAEIWRTFIENVAPEHRQHYTCNCCRHFFERFGGVVMLTKGGVSYSPIWALCRPPRELEEGINAVLGLVTRAPIAAPFIHDRANMGTYEAGGFRHVSVRLPISRQHRSRVLDAFQATAEKKEDHRCLSAAVAEFKVPYLQDAVRILKADAVQRSEKFLEHTEWLLALKLRQLDKEIPTNCKAAMLWRDVATAPAGWCKPRSQMIGTMLEDLALGMAFDQVKVRWNAKMDPLQYQRPQEAPKAGTIAQAEKLVEQLGIAPAFARRFAHLDEVEALWKPTAHVPKAPTGGLFSGVKAKGTEPSRELVLPAQTMTWEKFSKTVLPTAHEIELMVPRHGNFVALVTAADPKALPLLQWDREDRRNPVSWYLYSGGSTASRWGLTGSNWVKVPAITRVPANWFEGKSSYEGIFFLLEGAHDKQHKGSALFPETIRSELHGVRAVIEAYSKENDLVPTDGEPAAGLWFAKTFGSTPTYIRACGRDRIWQEYKLDRLD